MMKLAMLKRYNFLEKTIMKNNGIIGIDEVGRGPLAGPVVVCCVYINDKLKIPETMIIRDSKKMTSLQRKKVVDWANGISNEDIFNYSIAEINVEKIDEMNILKATLFGMKTAFESIKKVVPESNYDAIYVDGNIAPGLCTDKKITPVVSGDDKISAISIASIIAKEYRDDIMRRIGAQFPEYGFEKNVGYGTKQHLDALKKYGYTKHHRKSFAPIKNMTIDQQYRG